MNAKIFISTLWRNLKKIVVLENNFYLMRTHKYWIYFITNKSRTTLYIGVTNNLRRRIEQHYNNRGNDSSFAGKYHCFNLVYFEEFRYIANAIKREKQLKKWSRKKKDHLISLKNSSWKFLNDEI